MAANALNPGNNITKPEWFNKVCAHPPPLESTSHHVEGEDNSDTPAAAVILRYCYLTGNKIQQQKVDETIKEWEPYINLHFECVDDSKDTPIRIRFDSGAGSWSYVGTTCEQINDFEKPTMNLGWVDGRNKEISSEERGTILHEFGHVLGLMHEHQSPARSGTITLNEKAVYRFYRETQGWDKQQVKSQILNVHKTQDISNYSEVDLDSIMMYFMPSNMNRQHREIKPRNELSAKDKAYMLLTYYRPDPPTEWSLSHALDAAGIPTASHSRFIEKQDDPQAIRQTLSDWRGPTTVSSNSSLPSSSRAKEEHASLLDDLIDSTKCLFPSSGGRPYMVLITQEGEEKHGNKSTVSKRVLQAADKLLDSDGGRRYVVMITQEGK
ncbi:hypothetical protein QCA50_020027 [Cerrena zonata]|uniref:Peptidase metallopeptidase domain-containing protein n=1 Tax=Cerrena zonata TaxID=2478898 RepID=A0AAW0FHD0_9APHY